MSKSSAFRICSVMALATAAVLAVAAILSLVPVGPAPPAASTTAAPRPTSVLLGRGTITSIDANPAGKSAGHDAWWVVTVQPDGVRPGVAPRPPMRFAMHSPGMNGFRRVGQHVEIHSGDSGTIAVNLP